MFLQVREALTSYVGKSNTVHERDLSDIPIVVTRDYAAFDGGHLWNAWFKPPHTNTRRERFLDGKLRPAGQWTDNWKTVKPFFLDLQLGGHNVVHSCDKAKFGSTSRNALRFNTLPLPSEAAGRVQYIVQRMRDMVAVRNNCGSFNMHL